MKTILITLAFFLFSAFGFAQMPDSNLSKIEIYITPFYNSEGLSINVGKFSKGLASTKPEVFLKTIGKMKANWSDLSVEELYAGAIRLYDQEYRNESVYWFYTAQLRSRVFNGSLDQSKLRGMGSAGFELKHAQNSFYQLAGPYINGYAFKDTDKLIEIIEKVKKEGVPDLTAIYPKIAFISETDRKNATEEVIRGMDEFIEYLHTQKDFIKQQRFESGAEERFKDLKNKELAN